MMSRWCVAVLLASSLAEPQDATPDFDRVIAPLLAHRCLDCHSGPKPKGKLDLTTAAGLAKGGDHGTVVVAGKIKESLLWEQVNTGEMPPKKPLSRNEKELLQAWIREGARWGKTDPIDPYAYTTDKRAGNDFWSLQQIRKPAPPTVKDEGWVQGDIDRFVLAKLEAKGLRPNSPADPRTLVRRMHFDLIGLPPTPEEVEAFVKEFEGAGPSDACSRLIDRLLASPHYGERWARHWLDVVRYTESQGFEYDRFRPNAWHYRDYVISSFNGDKPYDVFMQEQIAGDVINFASPSAGVNSDGLIATSLLVCGPWDQAGNAQANATQRMATREEEQEDLISVVGQTFLGLTVNCARCHNHKFDPIPQVDYFRIKSALDGVKHGERPIGPGVVRKELSEKIASLQRTISEAQKTVATIEGEARKKAGGPQTAGAPPQAAALAQWTFDVDVRDAGGTMHGSLVGGAEVRSGRLVLTGGKQFMRTAPLRSDVREKTLEAWVLLPTLDQGGGGVITIESGNGGTFDSIVFAERQPCKWMAGSSSFQRTKDLDAAVETAGVNDLVHLVIVYRDDGSIAVYRNGRRYGESYRQHALQTYKAGDGRVLMGLRHTGSDNGYLKAEIDFAALYDRALSEQEVADLFAAGSRNRPFVSTEQLLAAMTDEQSRLRDTALKLIVATKADLAAVTPAAAGVSYTGQREQPKPTHRLLRGDAKSPAEVVSPGALSALKMLSPDFGLKPDAPEADRRVKLAAWLADPANPLPARVMANRLWHYHFGRGIVETPNDFGFSGVRPSHPQLLDWLAAEFMEAGGAKPQAPWSVKRLQKLILMSAAYRQASSLNPAAAAVDADNTLLWRYSPRRIEGELIRDAMLTVSGELNRQLGGPSFRPFTITNFNSDFYHLIDKNTPEFNRRTVYRAHVNSGKSPMMDALDCPDPAVKVPARRVTTTPLAALALMNNSFVQRQADAFASRVMKESKSEPAKAITLAYQYAFGRPPTAAEAGMAADLEKDHGMLQVCWVLMNATEFLYVK